MAKRNSKVSSLSNERGEKGKKSKDGECEASKKEANKEVDVDMFDFLDELLAPVVPMPGLSRVLDSGLGLDSCIPKTMLLTEGGIMTTILNVSPDELSSPRTVPDLTRQQEVVVEENVSLPSVPGPVNPIEKVQAWTKDNTSCNILYSLNEDTLSITHPSSTAILIQCSETVYWLTQYKSEN